MRVRLEERPGQTTRCFTNPDLAVQSPPLPATIFIL